MTSSPPLTWQELEQLADWSCDPVQGPTNSQARLRLFGQPESNVKVTLYRDHHAWCPYCQKVWIWLEEKQIPYRVEKITMFCYGEKEAWYKRKVPSGMLPALELEGRLITESDDILQALEAAFGPLGWSLQDNILRPLRQLERLLFRDWCSWLCRPSRSPQEESRAKAQFVYRVGQVEEALSQRAGPYFLDHFSVADVIFIPYVERMHASLFYYKGYNLRQENPRLGAWFEALETRSVYRGTQSDFHTHAHDLPPQMGGCWDQDSPQTRRNQTHVDEGPWDTLPDVGYTEPSSSRREALTRVLKHRQTLMRVNPYPDEEVGEALRCSLTHLIQGRACVPPSGSDRALRYLRDRISVPRDMSIYAAKRLRQSLEFTAALDGDHPGPPLPRQHRRDQDPAPFQG